MNALPRKSQTLWCYIWPRISINPFIIDPSLKSPQTNSKVSKNLPPLMLNQVWCCKPVHRSFCYPFKKPSFGLWHWHAQMWSITLHRGFSVSSLVFEKLWCSFCRSGWWITAWLFFCPHMNSSFWKSSVRWSFLCLHADDGKKRFYLAMSEVRTFISLCVVLLLGWEDFL